MKTLSIQVLGTQAEHLLHDLEDLHLIKVLASPTEKPKQKLSEKYAGKLPPEIAEALRQHVAEFRNEWN